MTGSTTSLRTIAEVALGRQRAPQHETGPNMVPYLRAANVKDGSLDLTDVKAMNFTPKEQQIFSLRPGDVLVTEGSGSLNAVGASSVWNGELSGTVCFQNTLLRLRPRGGTDSRFLSWWARYAHADGLFASVATGANIYHLSAERVRALPCNAPPAAEQRRIAHFLDAETARIDKLIASRQKQVSTLKEGELATISSMLSGGATSDDGFPTGWPWLPYIPRSWSIGPVYAYFQTDLGKMLNSERSVGDRQRPYLRNANIHWHKVDTSDVAMMSFAADEKKRYSVHSGDLLVCEGGAGVAEAAVWDGRIEECYFQKSLHRVRRAGEVPVEWLMYWLRLAKHCGAFEADGNIATIPHLTGEQLRQYRIPIPHDGESLVRKTERRIKAMAEFRAALSQAQVLLAERRQALITAAVTGQFDVSTASGRGVME